MAGSAVMAGSARSAVPAPCGHDPLGNPVSLQHPASAAALGDFVEGLLGYQPRVLAVLAAAEQDDSAIVQASAAALWMFSESPAGPPRARGHLDRAARAALPASEREQLFMQAVARWVDGDVAAALALHEQLAKACPRDLVSIKLGQYHAFNLGDSPTLLRLAWAARGAADDLAAWHAMLAFGLEQCHRLHEAERHARQALALQPHEPWAEHALAHVMLTEGRFSEGLALMQRASPPWRGLSSFMRTHNFWHLALFQIELGDEAAALALYDDEVWGVDTGYSQDQVGAVSLLARLEGAGVDVGERWQALADHLAGRVADQVQPFLDLQYLYGLARAGRPEADQLLANLVRHAALAPPASRQAWQQVALPAAQGLLLHGRGLADARQARWPEAATALGAAMPQLARIGGSHAQRELFKQLWIDALQRAGDHAAVLNLLQPRANALPQSRRLARRLHRVTTALQLPPR